MNKWGGNEWWWPFVGAREIEFEGGDHDIYLSFSQRKYKYFKKITIV